MIETQWEGGLKSTKARRINLDYGSKKTCSWFQDTMIGQIDHNDERIPQSRNTEIQGRDNQSKGESEMETGRNQQWKERKRQNIFRSEDSILMSTKENRNHGQPSKGHGRHK